VGEWSASRRDRFVPRKERPYRWSRYFEEEENLTLPEFELRTVNPVASRCTDFVIPAAVYIWNKFGCHNSVIGDGNRQPDKEVATSLACNYR